MPEDPIVLLIALLENNWIPGNTLDITPTFDSGWIDTTAGYHQINIHGNPDENASGASGISGIDPGSGGVVTTNRGMVFIECFAEAYDGGENPMKVARAFMVEVHRIVVANVNNHAEYDYINWIGMNRLTPKDDQRPFNTRYSCRVGYQYRYIG